jgi:hypothetical protein
MIYYFLVTGHTADVVASKGGGWKKRVACGKRPWYDVLWYYINTSSVVAVARSTCSKEHRHGTSVEGGSVNRCFQVENNSRKAGCGKLGRGRLPTSTARGNMQEESRGFSAAWFLS